jgi:hypothetical protein
MANFDSCFVPIHIGHHAIHENQPELAIGMPVERA